MNIAVAVYQMEFELERELHWRSIPFSKRDRLYFFDVDYCPLFAQVTWRTCERLTITSINDGIKQLRARGRNWALFSIAFHRRAQLIQDGLANICHDPIPFLAAVPTQPMGGWTLLDEHTIICSQDTTSPYPLGKVTFIENKDVPPSRAYLKLWEFFTLYAQAPDPGAHVLDMGASPGGWSWVLASLGCQVTAVDKAPLAPAIARMPNVRLLQESAFGLQPSAVDSVDWFFSDIICYPERLYELIMRWKAQGVAHFVCTIKFQHEADFAVIDKLLAIAGSRMVHLYHNKHEVTWWLIP